MPKIEEKLEQITHIPADRLLFEFLTAGSTSAFITFVTAPLERVKVLLQVQMSNPQVSKKNAYKGILDAFVRIPKEQGFLSFWRGCYSSILRAFPNAAFTFTWNEVGKEFLAREEDKKERFWSYFFGHLAAGGLAGLASAVYLHPLDYITTSMASDIGRDASSRQYRGLIHCVVKTIKSEGVFAFYRGFITSAQGVIIYRSTYFGFYDIAKDALIYPGKSSLMLSFLIAQTVTTISGLMAYPFDTVRRRMMMQIGLRKEQKFKSTLDCWIKIASQEGFKAFFKGALPNILTGTGSALLLVIYDESKKRYLLKTSK